jgi:hypothetical protein
MRGKDSMHDVAPLIGAWRRRLRLLVPRSWLSAELVPGARLRGGKPSPARMELVPESPASSWAAWEISRRAHPGNGGRGVPSSEQ